MISDDERKELQSRFRHDLNYVAEDPLEQIDPLSYHNPDGDSCLHIAAIRGDFRATELLLKAGLNIDEPGDMGSTPLHYAVTFKHIAIAELLIKHGASLNAMNEFQKTAVDLAKENGVAVSLGIL